MRLLETSTAADCSYSVSPLGRVISPAIPPSQRSRSRADSEHSDRRRIKSSMAGYMSTGSRKSSASSKKAKSPKSTHRRKLSFESVATQTEVSSVRGGRFLRQLAGDSDGDFRSGSVSLTSPSPRPSVDGSRSKSPTPVPFNPQDFKLGCPVRRA